MYDESGHERKKNKSENSYLCSFSVLRIQQEKIHLKIEFTEGECLLCRGSIFHSQTAS